MMMKASIENICKYTRNACKCARTPTSEIVISTMKKLIDCRNLSNKAKVACKHLGDITEVLPICKSIISSRHASPDSRWSSLACQIASENEFRYMLWALGYADWKYIFADMTPLVVRGAKLHSLFIALISFLFQGWLEVVLYYAISTYIDCLHNISLYWQSRWYRLRILEREIEPHVCTPPQMECKHRLYELYF